MSTYTLTYSDTVKGWPSFYTYYPDWMIGMNNYFYTFKGGNLYQHNSNTQPRNTFYFNWWNSIGNPNNAFQPSILKSVFNTSVLDNKLFKTISLQGDDAWDVTNLQTDLQTAASISSSWFEKKESAYFAFIRNVQGPTALLNTIGNSALRNINGIGYSTSVGSLAPGFNTIYFSINPLVDIGSILSVGDFIYFSSPNPAPPPPATISPVFAGKVTLIERDYPAGLNQITIDITGGTSIPTNTEFFLFVKDSIAESHGVLGHYCVFDIKNSNSNKVELFSVGSNVMKSYP